MQAVKRLAKKIPGALQAFRFLRQLIVARKLKDADTEDVFTDIYARNTWGDKDSVSGTGSNFRQTETLNEELPVLLHSLEITTLLDIPCGDFHWMSEIDIGEIDYIGADIVREIVQRNSEQHEGSNRKFRHLNLIADALPAVDLVFCRDCLVHFSFNDVFRALFNIAESDSTYLLTTTFTNREKNYDISTGDWRPLNLQKPPFNFPEPLQLINENCSEDEGDFSDKSLGVWRIDELRQHVSGPKKPTEK